MAIGFSRTLGRSFRGCYGDVLGLSEFFISGYCGCI